MAGLFKIFLPQALGVYHTLRPKTVHFSVSFTNTDLNYNLSLTFLDFFPAACPEATYIQVTTQDGAVFKNICPWIKNYNTFCFINFTPDQFLSLWQIPFNFGIWYPTAKDSEQKENYKLYTPNYPITIPCLTRNQRKCLFTKKLPISHDYV